MLNVHEFNHSMDDLGVGHVFEINGLPIRISTKLGLLEISTQAPNNIVTSLLKFQEALVFVG